MKLKLLIAYCTLLIFVTPVFALDSTPSAKAQDLLDRVATKVAQLSVKLQKAYRGKIKALGTTSIIISTTEADRAINTNDATSFFRFRAGNHIEVNFAALKVGDDLTAVGTIDPATADLTARQIVAKIKRTSLVGKITVVDKTILTVNATTKIDLADATSLKMVATSSGLPAGRQDKIVLAKETDFKIGSQIFAIIHSPDDKTGVFSVLKALTLQK